MRRAVKKEKTKLSLWILKTRQGDFGICFRNGNATGEDFCGPWGWW